MLQNSIVSSALPEIARALSEDKEFCVRILKSALQNSDVKVLLFEIVSHEERQHEVCFHLGH